MKPLHKHDCDQCLFLGYSEDETKDLYFCAQGGVEDTVIVRYSSEPSDNISGIVFAKKNPDLALAVTRSKEKGLL